MGRHNGSESGCYGHPPPCSDRQGFGSGVPLLEPLSANRLTEAQPGGKRTPGVNKCCDGSQLVRQLMRVTGSR